MSEEEYPLDLARQWVTIHPVDEQVSILRWIEDAKELGADLLEAMVLLLAEGSELERDVAATVLRFRGYQVLAGGGSPGASSYQVTDPDGALRMIDADSFATPSTPVAHRRTVRRLPLMRRHRDR